MRKLGYSAFAAIRSMFKGVHIPVAWGLDSLGEFTSTVVASYQRLKRGHRAIDHTVDV